MPRTFSYREIFERASGQAESAEIPETEIPLAQSQPEGSVAQPSGQDSRPSVQEKSMRADFGTWAVSEIQLCKMGSHGPQNEYISVASVPVGGN
jgi:activating signal cointegrator complex subunit 1